MELNPQLLAKTLLLFFTFMLSFGTVAALSCAPMNTYIAEVSSLNDTKAELSIVLYTDLNPRINGSINLTIYDEAIQHYITNISNNTSIELENKTYKRNISRHYRPLQSLQNLKVTKGDIITYGSPHGPCGTELILITLLEELFNTDTSLTALQTTDTMTQSSIPHQERK